MIEAAEPLVSTADVEGVMGGGGGAATPATPATTAPAASPPVGPEGGAPAAPTTPAEPAGPAAPAAPAESEFEIAPGRKVKASELTTWEKNHLAYEGIKPLRELDEFLSRPENEPLGNAIVALLKSKNPEHVQQILGVLAGQPAAAAAPAGGAPPANPLADIEKNLDLTDPSVKALYELTKSLHSKVDGFEQFRTTAQTESHKSQEAQRVTEAEGRLQADMDGAWKAHQFDALLERVDPKYRDETGKLMRSLMLTIAGLPGPKQIPFAQVAKTLHGQLSGLIEGVINAYNAKKGAVPPAGGGRGPVHTPPAVPELGSEGMQSAIVEGLQEAAAGRA